MVPGKSKSNCLHLTPKAQTTKEKIDKSEFTKILKPSASKDIFERVKRQPIEQEKIFANHLKRDSHPENRKSSTTTKKIHFSKEDIQLANKYIKRCSTSLVTKEMQITTTMRHYLHTFRMVIINLKKKNITSLKDVEIWEPLLTHGWWGYKRVQLL